MTARARAVQTALLGLLRDRGPMTDEELAAAYREVNADGALPRQSPRAIVERRRELETLGAIRPRWERVT